MRQPPETLERGWLDDLDLSRSASVAGAARFAGVAAPDTTPLLLRSRAPLGAGHDLLGQRGVVAIEVMATGGLDPLGPVELRRGAGGILFGRTVEALDEGGSASRSPAAPGARRRHLRKPSQSVT